MEFEVYDQQGNLLTEYDLNLGRLKSSVRIERHPAIEGACEVGHWETIREYPNGGKDIQWVIDVPGVEAQEAWDEEIPIYIYIPYTQAELDAIEAEENKPTQEERLRQLEEAFQMLLSGVTE